MIEVEELSKRFKTKQALDGVSFTAEDGKVTGFLGPNGAGTWRHDPFHSGRRMRADRALHGALVSTVHHIDGH